MLFVLCLLHMFSCVIYNVRMGDSSLTLLHRYYALDFQVGKYAVSILHSELLTREDTNWGFSRLAVEGLYCILRVVIIHMHLYLRTCTVRCRSHDTKE